MEKKIEKRCPRCKETKGLEQFNKVKGAPYTYCRVCDNAKTLKYSTENREKLNAIARKARLDNPQINRDSCRKYRNENIEKCKAESRRYYYNNREKLKEAAKIYYVKNKEKIKSYAQKRRVEKREEIAKSKRIYWQNNKKELNKNRYLRHKEQIKKDPISRIKRNVRRRLCAFVGILIEGKFSKSAVIGCDSNTLKKHIEDKFTEGMSWSNYGRYGWHIDHITPLSSAKTQSDLISLCHYTNLQPLWATDNIKKSNKVYVSKGVTRAEARLVFAKMDAEKKKKEEQSALKGNIAVDGLD